MANVYCLSFSFSSLEESKGPLQLVLDSSAPIVDAKLELARRVNVPWQFQRFIFCGMELDNYRSMDSYAIQHGTAVAVESPNLKACEGLPVPFAVPVLEELGATRVVLQLKTMMLVHLRLKGQSRSIGALPRDILLRIICPYIYDALMWEDLDAFTVTIDYSLFKPFLVKQVPRVSM